jgi:hypothetical protein
MLTPRGQPQRLTPGDGGKLSLEILDVVIFTIPGGQLRAVEEKLAVIARANQELEAFHRARAGRTPTA